MTEKLTCYIIDDEHLARQILEAYVAKVAFLELKGSFSSALEAADRMDTDRPDLLFLDINMPDLNGLSFISMLYPKPMIILTTAYDQYALKAFDLEVRDYLLKPIPFERFYKAVLRLQQEVKQHHPPQPLESLAPSKEEPEALFLKVGFKLQKVLVRDILFVEGLKDYLRLHTTRDKIITLLNFAQLTELLPAAKFCRVHRSYLVALDKIDQIEKNRIRIGEQTIPISDTYAAAFFAKLNSGV